MEYNPPLSDNEQNIPSEREILEDRRRKKEIALTRLKTIYLYSEEETSEKDFIIEREKIVNEITEIEARLAELHKEEHDDLISNEVFIQKASYFIMVRNLLDDRYIDYEKYIRKIDPIIPRNFLTTNNKKIEIDGGRVVSITFKNNITHRFIYH